MACSKCQLINRFRTLATQQHAWNVRALALLKSVTVGGNNTELTFALIQLADELKALDAKTTQLKERSNERTVQMR